MRLRAWIVLKRNRSVTRILWKLVPQLFADERHERMQQSEGPIKRGKKVLPRNERTLFVRVLQIRFRPFDIPIAKVAPEEVVDGLCRLVEAVITERFIHYLDGRGQPAKQPFIRQRYFSLIGIGSLLAHPGGGNVLEVCAAFFHLVKIDENESRRVPDLVRERF